MPALVLSAGLGTRLRPLTLALPKALVPIGDRPALSHVLARVAPLSAGPIVINAHHAAPAIEAFARGSEVLFFISHEPELLGTGGAIAHASALLGPGEVIVWNGDIWTELTGDMLRPLDPGTSAALVVERCALAPGHGNVGVAEDGSIVRLRRITARTDKPELWSANFLGIHRLDDELRSRAPVNGCAIADLYLPAIADGRRLEARVTEAPWIDVGASTTYLQANLAWLGARSSYVSPGVDIGPNVEVVKCVIGANARVTGSGRLERVVVWPGATAVAPLADAIVMSDRAVPVSSASSGA